MLIVRVYYIITQVAQYLVRYIGTQGSKTVTKVFATVLQETHGAS